MNDIVKRPEQWLPGQSGNPIVHGNIRGQGYYH